MRRAHTPARAAGLALVLLAAALGVASGCSGSDETTSSTPISTAAAQTTATAPTTSTTAVPTTLGPVAAPATWEEIQAPDLSGVWSVALSGDVLLVMTSDGKLHVGAPGSVALEELPTEGRVQDYDIDGPLVAWTEYLDEDFSATALYTYRLPEGPKRRVLEQQGMLMNPRLDGGRLFVGERLHVQGVPFSEDTLYDTHTIWMAPLDGQGLPAAAPVKVTEEPNSSHEPGGDELWSYDVAGSTLAYQRDWGVAPGVHVLDLDSRATTYLGPGSIPSVSQTLVAWRVYDEQGFAVRAYDPATGLVATLAENGHMPFCGPGYVVYVGDRGGDPTFEEVVVLDETSGREVVAGERRATDGFPYVSLAGTEEHLAWATEGTPEMSRVSLLRRVAPSPADTVAPLDIFADAVPPPVPAGRDPAWPDHDGWTVVVASLPDSGPRSEVAAWEQTWRLLPGTLLPMLHSDEHPNLDPGYWVVYSGVYATRAEAEAHLDEVRAQGITDAYVAEVRTG